MRYFAKHQALINETLIYKNNTYYNYNIFVLFLYMSLVLRVVYAHLSLDFENFQVVASIYKGAVKRAFTLVAQRDLRHYKIKILT